MFTRAQILKILRKTKCIDTKYEMFGASKHRYRLNSPLKESFVHRIEEKYGFTLPEDYFRFITKIGDGGAGPAYGINPFIDFIIENKTYNKNYPYVDKYIESYRHSLAKPFTPRQMMSDEVEDYAIATIKAYEQNPENYFIYETSDDNDLCDTNGFFVLGTHGCQWDFGLITAGEKRGQIFDTDNEGAYGFVAASFDEFYQNWLEEISDTENFKKELEKWGF